MCLARTTAPESQAPTVTTRCGAFVCPGAVMAALPDSVAELDEALFHASLVPPDERTIVWHRWVDALTDQRNRLTKEQA